MRGTTERRDCRQAAVSAAGTAVWLLAAAAVLLWVRQAFFPSGAASVLLAVLAAVQAAGLIPLGLALRDRLKEIKEENYMKLVSIETIPGQEFEALDIVRGTVVYSKNFGRDFMAGMKTLVGGEITGYTEMLVEARQIATKRMVDAAEALGADAVIGLRFASSSVMQGGRGGHRLRHGGEVPVIRATFLDHSGFLVELADVCLLFDWWKGALPPCRKSPWRSL